MVQTPSTTKNPSTESLMSTIQNSARPTARAPKKLRAVKTATTKISTSPVQKGVSGKPIRGKK